MKKTVIKSKKRVRRENKTTKYQKKKVLNKNKKKNLADQSKKKIKRKNPKSKNKTRKVNKKIMKGGAIPFSELNPNRIMEQASFVTNELLGGITSDNPQPVPNNLGHNVNSSPLSQPYLENSVMHEHAVIGDSPSDLFAYA